MNFFHQKKYRTFLDESYYPETEPGKTAEKWRYAEIRGKFGMVYAYSHDWLGVQVKAGRIAEQTRRGHKDWQVIQDCDDFVVFKVKNECLDEVAGIIRARKRRAMTPEQAETMRKRGLMLAAKYSKPGQKATSAA